MGRTLKDAFHAMLQTHQGGTVIASSKTVAVMQYDEKYYFVDSHSCGPKGASAKSCYGRACAMECDILDRLVYVWKCCFGKEQFDLNYVDVTIVNNHEVEVFNHNDQIHNPLEEITQPLQQMNKTQIMKEDKLQTIPLQTSMMGEIDVMQPNVEEELKVSNKVMEIKRKTEGNIVNEARNTK